MLWTGSPARFETIWQLEQAPTRGAKGQEPHASSIEYWRPYLRIGDERIRLRANKGAKGDTRTGTQVVSVLLLWPVAPFIKGKNTSIKKGASLLAFTDTDVELAGPVPPPPPEL